LTAWTYIFSECGEGRTVDEAVIEERKTRKRRKGKERALHRPEEALVRFDGQFAFVL
jgi:hypothetical protein